MAESKTIVKVPSYAGAAWLCGWLFTIGYLHLAFVKIALALALWPYFIGIALR